MQVYLHILLVITWLVVTFIATSTGRYGSFILLTNLNFLESVIVNVPHKGAKERFNRYLWKSD